MQISTGPTFADKVIGIYYLGRFRELALQSVHGFQSYSEMSLSARGTDSEMPGIGGHGPSALEYRDMHT